MIGVIEVNPRTSRLGFPFDPFERLSGRPLLTRTVEAALRCPDVDPLLVLVPAGEAKRVESELAGLKKALEPSRGGPSGRGKGRKGREPRTDPAARLRVLSCEGEDIRDRERIRRLRRLAPSSWRAGWAIPYAVAEAGNPRWLLPHLSRFSPDRVMLFPQAAPFLDPGLIAEVIAAAEAHTGPLARLSTAPPGIAGDILDLRLLVETGRLGIPVDLPMRFYPGQPERSLENKQVFHWFPLDVSGFATRLTAESRRGLALLEGVEEVLGPEGPGSPPGSWLRRLRERPRSLAGPVPAEVRFLVTGRSRTASPFEPPGGGTDMDPGLFARIAREVGSWQECRLVIAGGEPLLHPGLAKILEGARESGAGIVEVETDGRGLDPSSLDLLALADLVTVAVDAALPETFKALKGVDALPEVERGIESLLARSAAGGGWPVVAVEFRVVAENKDEVETFFDRWYPRTPFVIVGSPSDRAGQIPPRALHPARTPDRIPCLRILEALQVLPDGRACACENDFQGLAPVGDLRTASVREVWTGGPLSGLREAHARGGWDAYPLCSRCGDWCRR